MAVLYHFPITHRTMALDEWIGLVEKDKDMHSFVKYVKSDKAAIEVACTTNYSNGIMEGTVNKIKEIKRTMFNRAEIELLRAKVIHINHKNIFTQIIRLLPLN